MGVDNLCVKKLQLLTDTFNNEDKLHISDTHLKGGKHYFMCLGKPYFSAPRMQIEVKLKVTMQVLKFDI